MNSVQTSGGGNVKGGSGKAAGGLDLWEVSPEGWWLEGEGLNHALSEMTFASLWA